MSAYLTLPSELWYRGDDRALAGRVVGLITLLAHHHLVVVSVEDMADLAPTAVVALPAGAQLGQECQAHARAVVMRAARRAHGQVGHLAQGMALGAGDVADDGAQQGHLVQVEVADERVRLVVEEGARGGGAGEVVEAGAAGELAGGARPEPPAAGVGAAPPERLHGRPRHVLERPAARVTHAVAPRRATVVDVIGT